jgi:hypothetical protein
MCDAQSGDYSQRIVRRARRWHECWACREPIEPGTYYALNNGVGDGFWWTIKHCMRCDAMVKALHDRGVRVVDLDLNCGEIWERPPEHVAALAFALPSDFAGEQR